MNFLNRLFNRQIEKAVQQRISVLFPSMFNIGGTSAVYPDANTETYIEQGYLTNADVFSIVNIPGRKLASIPWYVYKVKDEKALKQYKQLTKGDILSTGAYERAMMLRRKAIDENIVDNDLNKRLAKPNNSQGQDSFFESLYIFYLLTGEANIWLNRGVDERGLPAAQGEIAELRILPTQFVDVIPDKMDPWGILGYNFRLSGSGLRIPSESMIVWKTFNPEFDASDRKHLRGLSPLRALWKKVQMGNDGADAAVAMFQHGGARGAITQKVPMQLTPDQRSMIEGVVDSRVNNNKRKSTIAALQGSWDYLNFGLSSVDMALLESMKVTKKDIAIAFGVPPPLIDDDSSTYNNRETALKELTTHKVAPDAAKLRDMLNARLLPEFGLNRSQFFIDFDITGLPEMQKDMEKLVMSLQAAYWFTPNEKRTMMNEEELTDANMDKIYLPSTLQPLDHANQDMGAGIDESVDQLGKRGLL